MKITILFFGITTDFIGDNSIKFEIKEGSSIAEFKMKLISKYPSLKNINDFAIAVNEEYAEDTTVLKSSDVVAIIPPVSGG